MHNERTEADLVVHQLLNPCFSVRVCALMESAGWTAKIFMVKTNLSRKFYRLILKGEKHKWQFIIAVNICHALEVSIVDAEVMLLSADLSFYTSSEKQEYIALFVGEMRNCTNSECNVYLKTKGLLTFKGE